MARRQSKDKLERLDTPDWVSRALVRHLPALAGMPVLEPCAGANAIGRVLADEAGCAVSAYDIEPRDRRVSQADTLSKGFFSEDCWPDAAVSAVVTNTPFSLAAEYWRRTRHFALVVLLVRITWLEATKEREDIADPDALIIVPRAKFTGPGAIDPETNEPYEGGDNATVCWAIWSRQAFLPTVAIRRVNRKEKAELERVGLLTLAPVASQRSLLEATS